jgi:SAM-dependent methyltransferase
MPGIVARQLNRLRIVGRHVADGSLDELWHLIGNRVRKIDLEYVSVEDLGLPRDRAYFHSSSGGADCAKILRSIEIPPGSVALDYGSGKGGAALTLARFPFNEVIGVELSADLVRIARDNVTRVRRRNVRFVHCDAEAFTDLDSVTHVYMYNPFPCTVVQGVLANLRASLGRRERTVTLIYKNPICHDALVAGPAMFVKVHERKLGEHWWYVYLHQGARQVSVSA